LIVNITMLVKDRPRLTRQAIESLYANTPRELFDLYVRDDGSTEENVVMIREALTYRNAALSLSKESKGTGKSRNRVIEWARNCSPSDLLYLSDNDVYFKPGWLETLLEA